jgi:beta-barrel assembly-enhancing protease
MRSAVLILMVIVAVVGCATTNLHPLTDRSVELEADEARIWTRCQEQEQLLDKRGLLYEDIETREYVNEVAAKLQPAEVYAKIPFRVEVIKDPRLNAFAFPNGVIYVHTGILSRMENEAQLATLLAHEMTHCTHRHAVKQFRDLQNKTALLATVQVTTAPLGGIGDLATLLGALGTMAAVTGYSREHETEADEQGFRRVVEAGYDPQETPKLFQHLKRDIEEEKIKEPFFFGTHPRVQERIENYERLLAREKLGPMAETKNAEQFTQKVHRVFLDNASLDLKRGRFNQAQSGIEKYLAVRGDEARPYFLLGELCRQRGGQGDAAKAIGYYRKSIEFDPSYAEAHRGLGFLYLKEKEKGQAKAHFERYLALAPQAADRLYIEQYMKELQ